MFKPILFNTEMVKAIQSGCKTQTRRLMRPQPTWSECGMRWFTKGCWWREGWNPMESLPDKEIPIKPGDILWVRETWSHGYIRSLPNSKGADTRWWEPTTVGRKGSFAYRAEAGPLGETLCISWKPSIHMPKQAARIFLRVKSVRAERLQEITVLDAISEGCGGTICDHADAHPTLGCTDCLNTGWLETPDAEFAQLWDTTIKPADRDKYGWNANPWVWVIEFERIEKPEDWV